MTKKSSFPSSSSLSTSLLLSTIFVNNKNQYTFAVINGLLGSSCCLIQLVLNFFSIGCAGFSVLTPYRTIFLGMSAIFIIGLFYKYGFRSKRRTFTLLFIVTFLTFLPELVSLYNQGKLAGGGKLERVIIGSGEGGRIGLEMFGGRGGGDGQDRDQESEKRIREQLKVGEVEVEVYVMKIKGIKCEGCANRIKNYFEQKPNIIDSKVFFDNQTAIIEVWPVGSYNDDDKKGGEIFKVWVKAIDFQYEPIILQQYIITKKV